MARRGGARSSRALQGRVRQDASGQGTAGQSRAKVIQKWSNSLSTSDPNVIQKCSTSDPR
eukprot:6628482-Heterocapsa_arctica.AAC.1